MDEFQWKTRNGKNGKAISFSNLPYHYIESFGVFQVTDDRACVKLSYTPRGHNVTLADAKGFFARRQIERGLQTLLIELDLLASQSLPHPCHESLSECSIRIREFGVNRLEYTVLAITALENCGS